MTMRLSVLRVALLSTIAAPTAVWAEPPTPTCSNLATDPAWGLAGNPSISNLTAAIVPATATDAAYCQVNLTDATLAGGVAPDYVIAQVNPTRTRKVCMYPNTPVYGGSGSTDDQASFSCKVNAQDDPALLSQTSGLLPGDGPLPGNHDIGNLP